MNIGIRLFAIAVGAILRFAVTTHAPGIDLGIVGVILMVVGGIGLWEVCGCTWPTADRPSGYGDGDAGATGASAQQPA